MPPLKLFQHLIKLNIYTRMINYRTGTCLQVKANRKILEKTLIKTSDRLSMHNEVINKYQ